MKILTAEEVTKCYSCFVCNSNTFIIRNWFPSKNKTSSDINLYIHCKTCGSDIHILIHSARGEIEYKGEISGN